MTKLTSFEADIRPLFTERDIRGMSKAFNLASYNEVKAHVAAIYDRIRGTGGAVMPPAPPRGEGPWPRLALTYLPNGWRMAVCLKSAVAILLLARSGHSALSDLFPLWRKGVLF